MAEVFNEGVLKVATLVPLKADGNPGRVDGVPQWTNSNPAVVEMIVAADGLSAQITTLAAGTAQLVATADADLGDGVREIMAIGDIIVSESEVVTMTMSFQDPPTP